MNWWAEMVVYKDNLAQVGGLTWWGNMVGFHIQIQDELQRGYELSKGICTSWWDPCIKW